MFFVLKKDPLGVKSGLRVVIDFRKLNEASVKNRFPIPRIDILTDQVKGAKFFTKMDLRYGYHQIRIREGDEHKTAFTADGNLYEFLVMPLGLCNAPSVFQEMMNTILGHLYDKGVIDYLDDIMICAETLEELTAKTKEVLQLLRVNGLHVKPEKCVFNATKLEFLGFVVSGDGIEMDPQKTKAIETWPRPKKLRDIQAFIGFCNWYRRFIRNFSKIARPLHNLTKKKTKFLWTEKEEAAFKLLKEAFKKGPLLLHPDVDKPFFLKCDASGYAIRGELSQKGPDGKRHPVAFMSKGITPAERNYDVHNRELLAILTCLHQWKHYLLGTEEPFEITSDHKNLEVFTKNQKLKSRQVRWSEELAWYNFVIKHQSGADAGRTDALSRRIDHTPDEKDRPELQGQVLSSDVFVNIAWEALETNEGLLMDAICETLETDEQGSAVVQALAAKKSQLGTKELNDWSFSNGFLKKKGRIYVPKDKRLRKAVMILRHDHVFASHPGPVATEELVRRRFFWPKMGQTIHEYVSGCESCQRNKSRQHAPFGLLQPLQAPDRKWQSISYDFITDLPESEGKNAVLVVVDRFSKGAHFIPCNKEESAQSTARLFLDNVWKLHGLPSSAVSDRGTQFNNAFLKELYALLGIEMNLSTAFHPQTDGQTERLNQILEEILRHYVSERQDDWTKYLSVAEFAYNNHQSSTTKHSPFEIWYGEEMVMDPSGPQ